MMSGYDFLESHTAVDTMQNILTC